MGQSPTTVDPHLLAEQSGWVLRLAHHLVRDPGGADDVAQETLLAGLAAPPHDVHDARRLRAWLGRVVFNLAHLSTRRNVRRRAREEVAARSERQRSTAEAYIRSTVLDQVGEAVSGLPEPYRGTVEMRYFEGRSTAEIARLTGASESAVRKRLWRARGHLRRSLDGRHNGERQAWFQALAPVACAGRLARSGPAGGGATLGWGAGFPLALTAGVTALLALPLLLGSAPGGDGTDQADASARGFGAGAVPEDAAAAGRRTALAGLPGVGERAAGARPPADRDGGPQRPVPVESVRHPVGHEGDGPDASGAAGHELVGSVVDLDGNPLGGLAVRVRPLGGADPDVPLGDVPVPPAADSLSTAFADASGRFRVRVDALPVVLAAEGAGFASLQAVRVDADTAAAHHWLVSAPGVDLAGRVLDAEGRALAGAQVAVVAAAEAFLRLPFVARVPEGPLARVRTDEAGRFRLRGVPSGPGLVLETSHPVGRTDRRPVPVHGDGDLVVCLAPARVLELAGRVQDRLGRPVGGAFVSWGACGERTDARGRFRLERRDDGQGEHGMRVTKQGYRPTELPAAATLDGTRHLALTLEGTPLPIRGEVRERDGRGTPGWVVFARPRLDAHASTPRLVTDPEAVAAILARGVPVAEDGSFGLLGDVDTEYALFAVHQETRDVTEVAAVRGGDEGVCLVARTRAPGSEGLLVASGGLPLADARVAATLELATDEGAFALELAVARTDARGSFRLDLPVDGPSQLFVQRQALGGARRSPGEPARTRPNTWISRAPAGLRLVGFTASSFSVLAADGAELPLGGPGAAGSRAGLSGGRSAAVAVDPRAATLVWYADGAEAGRAPLTLVPGEVREVRGADARAGRP